MTYSGSFKVEGKPSSDVPNTIPVRLRTGPRTEDHVVRIAAQPKQQWLVKMALSSSFRGQFTHSHKGKRRRQHVIRPMQAHWKVIYEGEGSPHIDDLPCSKDGLTFYVGMSVPNDSNVSVDINFRTEEEVPHE